MKQLNLIQVFKPEGKQIGRKIHKQPIHWSTEEWRVEKQIIITMDFKRMIDFETLKEKGIDISNFPKHNKVAFQMGVDSMIQKEKFVGLIDGPKYASDFVHLISFDSIKNGLEKADLVKGVLQRAEVSADDNGFIFINHK